MNKTNASIIAFQETKKEVLSSTFLKSISNNKNFIWHHLPTKGTAGGVLVGVDSDIFEVLQWSSLGFTVSCKFVIKASGVRFRLVAVYGSPYEDGKEDFISELHNLFIDDHQPSLIGGDFSLVRYQQGKSNGNINHHWADKFNAWVEIWSLLEIEMAGIKFAWVNNQENVVM